jgi:hypothetical protein
MLREASEEAVTKYVLFITVLTSIGSSPAAIHPVAGRFGSCS